MTKVIPTLSLTVLLSAGCISGSSAFAADIPVAKKPLSEAVINTIGKKKINFETAEALYNDVLLKGGNGEQLVAGLEKQASNPKLGKGVRSKALLTLSFIHWREGRMENALESAESGLKLVPSAQLTLQKAKILDATGDEKSALIWYKKSIPMLNGEQLEQIQVRVTLMESGSDPQPLAKLARQKGNGFRNRASVALAILGHERQAIELYRVDADASRSDKYRQHIRLADWSIRANDAERAQQEAWEGVQLANLKRDRRYALALLVEAHRLNDSIDTLVARLEAQKTLTPEERRVWVELLRETEQYNRAIAEFKNTSEEWSPELKRELIGLYRESGNDKAMEAEFIDFIASNPEEPTWPLGLSGYYLENGRKTEAESVWQNYIDHNERAGNLLTGAEAMIQVGLDNLAEKAIGKVQRSGKYQSAANMMLFELHLRRGRMDEANQLLVELDKSLPANSRDRLELADGYERTQQLDRALIVLSGLQANGVELGMDGEMRIAWLQQSLGFKEESLQSWFVMLDKTPDAQRRLVEDRIFMLSAELGKLGRTAIDLEKKVLNKTANENDARMLIKLYSKVNDSGAAIEIVEAFFGGDVKAQDKSLYMQEEARIYQALGDYDAYDKVTRQLLALEPDHSATHLQSLILNNLEKSASSGDEDEEELENLLAQYNDASQGVGGKEFEAGILDLAGFPDKAINTYRTALAENPDVGDNYLVMANLMKSQDRKDEAIRMFQYVAERAERDDLYVIAIDGLLNMRPEDPSILRWAQRMTMERLTSKSDKVYLYMLLADLANDSGDIDIQMAALENSLSHANSRRAVVLRELTVLTKSEAGTFGQAPKNPDLQANLRYSRRLVAMRQEFPPEVFINMGKSFLKAGEPIKALSAFDMAIAQTGRDDLREEAARQLEMQGYDRLALTQYEKSLITNSGDLNIRWRLGELKELAGWNQAANEQFSRALQDIYVRHQSVNLDNNPSQTVLVNSALEMEADLKQDSTKTDEYKKQSGPLRGAFIRTLPTDRGERTQALQPFIDLFSSELRQVTGQGAVVHHYPRLSVVSQFLRQVALMSSDYQLADRVDSQLLAQFGDDKVLMQTMVAQYRAWGRLNYDNAIDAYDEVAEPVRTKLTSYWHRAEKDNIKPLIKVKANQSIDDIRDPLGSKNREYASRLNTVMLTGGQDSLMALFQEMAADKLYAQVVEKAAVVLTESSFKQLCEFIAQRIRTDKEAFNSALTLELPEYNESLYLLHNTIAKCAWLNRVEEAIGEPLFGENDLLQRVAEFKKLPTLNAHYVMYHLSAKNRLVFLNNIGPHFKDSKSLIMATLLAAAEQVVSPAEKALWLEQLAKYGRVYDDMWSITLPAPLAAADIRAENVDFVRETTALIFPKSLLQGNKVNNLDIKLHIVAGDIDKAAETLVSRYLQSKQLPGAFTAYGRGPLSTVRSHVGKFEKQFSDVGRSHLLNAIAHSDGDKTKLADLTAAIEAVLLADQPEKRKVALQKLVIDHPENEVVLDFLCNTLEEQGDYRGMVSALQGFVQQAPSNSANNTYFQQKLAAAWNALGQPIKVLAAGGLKASEEVDYLFASLRSKPAAALKKAVASGDPQVIQRQLRKFWQQTTASHSQGVIDFNSLRFETFMEMKWPEQIASGDRGKSLTLLDGMLQYSFSLAELELWVSTMPESMVDQGAPIIEALADAEVAYGDPARRIEQLSDKVASGNSNDITLSFYLALLSKKPQLASGEIMAQLTDIFSSTSELRLGQLTVLAQLLAHNSQLNESLNAYRSVANKVMVFSQQYSSQAALNARMLLADAAVTLDKRHYAELLADVLKLAQVPMTSAKYPSFGEFVVTALEPELNSASFKPLFEPLLQEYVAVTADWSFNDVVKAAYLQARNGELDRALDSLEQGLAPAVTTEGSDELRSGYLYRTTLGLEVLDSRGKVQPSWQSSEALSRLLPSARQSWPGAAQWLTAVAGKVSQWLVSDTMDHNALLELATTIAIRLAEIGEDDKAEQLVGQIANMLDSDKLFNVNAASFSIAALQDAGLPIDAGLARKFINRGLLNTQGVIAVVKQTAKQQGAKNALALGKSQTEWSLDEELLKLQISIAEQAGLLNDVKTLKTLQQQAQLAKSELAGEVGKGS